MIKNYSYLSLAAALLLAGGDALAQQGVNMRTASRGNPSYAIHAPGAHNTFSRGGGYCTAAADGQGDPNLGLEERIINVMFSDIDNDSPDVIPVDPAYQDFTSAVGNVVAGQSYPFGVDVAREGANTSYSENQVLIWIDLNGDDDFTDAGELVHVSAIGSVDIYTGDIAIPGTATLGTTRMRIRLHDTHDGSAYINNFNDTPCGVSSYGEVEDYTVQITSGGGTPANDECAGSVTQSLAIGSSVTFTGDNTGATDTEGLDTPSVWESFTTTECANITLTYCGTTPAFSNAFLNLFVDCPFTAFLPSTSFETTSCLEGNVTIQYVDVPAGTYYYAVLTEPGAVGPYTIEVSAVACAPAGPYCDAAADGVGDPNLGLEERIINVTFSNIDNDSPDVIPTAPAYQNFTSVVANVVAGQTYPFAVDVSREGSTLSYAENQVIIWIDYNQDGDFVDAGELAHTSAIGAVDIYSGDITIPGGASLGATRMRIRLHDTHDGSAYINNFNDTPCGMSSYGEVEDYTVQITSGGSTPANDECTGSVTQSLAIGSSVTFTGDNTGATDTEGLDTPSVWESFTTTECANITLTYCGTTPAFENAFLNLFIGCPFTTFLPSTSFETASCGDNNVTIQYVDVPAGTYYYAVLTEAGAVGPYTIEVSAVACAPAGPYCDAAADGVGDPNLGLEERIINVTFSNIDNDSPDVIPTAPAYQDFTSEVGDVIAGQVYPFAIDVAREGSNTSYSENQVIIWIDYNQDGDFVDAGELVHTSAIGAVDIYTGDITIPGTASLGTTRMRIRLHDTHDGSAYINNFNDTPCGMSSYGEVEDYTVAVVGVITAMPEVNTAAWSVFPNPSNGDFTIACGDASGKVGIEVLDLTGRLVHSDMRVATAGTTMSLELAGKLATGTYLLRLVTDTGSSEQRIVVR